MDDKKKTAMEERRKKLELLSSFQEGVSERYKRSSANVNRQTWFISLGGLGGATINQLKKKVTRSFGDTKNIHFLAIDTDSNRDLKGITKSDDEDVVGNGYLEKNETFPIYEQNPKVGALLDKGADSAPAYMREWLNPRFPARKIDNKGAGQTRQIGRVMLLQEKVRAGLAEKLSSIIHDINENRLDEEPITVFIIAGISGGTGSGTIIDFTYLLHREFEKNNVSPAHYEIAAYIYCPDAQLDEEGIKNTTNVPILKRNGYAALKEIDYFYNLKSHFGKYYIGKDENNSIEEDIFSSCTLISACKEGSGMYKLTDIMEALTDLLVDNISGASYQIDEGQDSNGQKIIRNAQMMDSYVCNKIENTKTFLLSHANDEVYPKMAYFRYNMIGYSSVEIPKNQILAYLAYKLFEKVKNQWDSLKEIAPSDVHEIFRGMGGDTASALISYAKMKTEDAKIPLVLPERETLSKKEVKDIDLLSEAKEDAVLIANKLNDILQNKQDGFYYKLHTALTDQFMKKIDEYFEKKGPYATIELITQDKNDKNFSGILETLDAILNEIETKRLECEEKSNLESSKCKSEIQNLFNDAVGRIRNPFDHTDYVKKYMDYVYDKAYDYYVRRKFYELLESVINDVRADIQKANNDIWEVYTAVLDEIMKLLKKDAEITTQSSVYRGEAGKTTYSFEVLDLKGNNEKKAKLESLLADYVSDDGVAKTCERFIKSMKENRAKWVGQVNNGGFSAQQEVQQLFDEFFNKFVSEDNLIEKFIVAVYQEEANSIDKNRLDEIWGDMNRREKALKRAAREILRELKKLGMTMGTMATDEAHYQMDDFNPKRFLVMPEETPSINNAIKELIENGEFNLNDAQFTTARGICKFSYSQLYIGLPLYAIKGMKDWDETYRDNADKTIGLHMDENIQNWRDFPQPYILDCAARGKGENYYSGYHDYKVLKEIKELVDEAIGYGMVYGPRGQFDNRDYYLLDVIDMNESILPSHDDIVRETDTFVSTAYQNNTIHDSKLADLMKQIGYLFKPVKLTIDNNPDMRLMDLDGEGNDSYVTINGKKVGDLYKIVRMHMDSVLAIKKDMETWRLVKKEFDRKLKELEDTRLYDSAFKAYSDALKYGCITQAVGHYALQIRINDIENVLTDQDKGVEADKLYLLFHGLVAFLRLSEADRNAVDFYVKNAQSGVDVSAWKAELQQRIADLGKYDAGQTLEKQMKYGEHNEDYKITNNIKNKDIPRLVLLDFCTDLLSLL